jgi:nitrogen regulatory protein P-II 1
MIKIEAIVREEKLEDIKEALSKIEVNGVTVSQVMGCGNQKGHKELVRGTEVSITMLPKIKFEIIVPSEELEKKVIKVIQEFAYTGNHGDGKIFSYNLRNVLRVRTKEIGIAAI